MRNPLIHPILSILREHPDGVGEFFILTYLKKNIAEFNTLASDANLQLFRQHFLIMNALYQLQASLWQEEQVTLSISGVHIRLMPAEALTPSSGTNDVNNSADAKLAAYYLDWSEYEKTDEAEVGRLLDSFYTCFNHNANRDAALETLKLDEKAPSKDVIKRQYRKLAHQAHPDRGGDTEQFIALRQAYECLMF